MRSVGPGYLSRDMADEDTCAVVADDIAFLDTVRSLPAAAARKEQLALALSVSPGDVVIEVGPGTGEDLQRFAAACGREGLAIGVDISLGLATEAKRRAPDAVLVVADAAWLPFRAGVFSRGYVERVLQHVPRVENAVAELFRVLTPGGRVLVFEPDQELRALDHPDRETERLLRLRIGPQVANPAIGRQLFRLLTEAGFVVESIEGIAAGQPRSAPIERVADVVSKAVTDGELDRERAEVYLATLRTMADAGTLFSVWVAFEIGATKPS